MEKKLKRLELSIKQISKLYEKAAKFFMLDTSEGSVGFGNKLFEFY